MNYLVILFLLLIIFLLFYYINFNLAFIEKFYNRRPVTWTPYVIDVYNQPAYSNYFYQNGYMFPVY